MNKQQLIELRTNVQPLYETAQAAMLRAKAGLEFAEQAAKEAKIAALGRADGKNEAQRTAAAYAEPAVINLVDAESEARQEFAHAYAEYKKHKAVIDYVRDMTALLALGD